MRFLRIYITCNVCIFSIFTAEFIYFSLSNLCAVATTIFATTATPTINQTNLYSFINLNIKVLFSKEQCERKGVLRIVPAACKNGISFDKSCVIFSFVQKQKKNDNALLKNQSKFSIFSSKRNNHVNVIASCRQIRLPTISFH